ncbi:MAG: hypothetical protein IT376_15325 [Polyangiaceae bacterium]|nr:hypothetical protein [Polyangiaceae bacterium]
MTSVRERPALPPDGERRRAESEALADAAERLGFALPAAPARLTAGWHESVGHLTELRAAAAPSAPPPTDGDATVEATSTRLELDELGTITISLVRRDGLDRLVIEARPDVLRGLERELPALLASLRGAGASVTAVALLARADAGTGLARPRSSSPHRAPDGSPPQDPRARSPRRRPLRLEG